MRPTRFDGFLSATCRLASTDLYLEFLLDMAAVADEGVDALYSAHNLEHVHAYEVPVVLKTGSKGPGSINPLQ